MSSWDKAWRCPCSTVMKRLSVLNCTNCGAEAQKKRGSHFLRRVVIGCAAIARAITLRQRNNATNARRRGRLDREGLQKFMKMWALKHDQLKYLKFYLLINCFTYF